MTHPLDTYLRTQISELSETERAGARSVSDKSAEWWWRVFEAQATSRHLDFVARELQQQGRGFYTIGSAGHESNALVAMALRPTDPALLHYRSGAFYVARAGQVPGSTPVRDMLQGLMALADEPIAGGRHKVFGHPDLGIIPQTSTVASHLPRAVGLAVALHRAYRLGVPCEWPEDAVVVCSFGDASANHSTATGAINTAIATAYRGLPVPMLFVCEDNGWGISVPTPPGWVEAAYGSRPGLDYVAVDGTQPAVAAELIDDAVRTVREQRRPVFLHLKTVRFLGHAGSDAEIAYRRDREITADYARDPLLPTARQLVAAGVRPAEVLARYEEIRADIDAEAERLAGGRQARLGNRGDGAPRAETPGPGRGSGRGPPRVRSASRQAADPGRVDQRHPGPDPGRRPPGGRVRRGRRAKGGVYGVTRGLARRHGAARVFDTVLDEQSILGLGLGAGLAGLIPIPEIQYLAYLHNAEDQLRGEGATLPFFSRGRFRNPMVVRVAGLAYQKGFGGHFHNDNALGVLRDIPGLVVACPARPDDAAAMLRTCVAAAITDATLSVFLEPIALYHRRDLLRRRGRRVARRRPRRARPDRPGPGLYEANEPAITLITFGNGVPMSLRVARRLAESASPADVLDLRWLAPLPVADLLAAVAAYGPGAGRRRDPAVRRSRRGSGHRAGRGRVRRADHPGGQRGQLRPAGTGGAARAAQRSRHRESSHHAGWDRTFMTGIGPLELLGIDHLLSDDERDIQASVREFVDRRVRPNIAEWYERGELDLALMREAGALGLLGMHLEGYGCAGTNAVSYGLACLELEAGDSGVRSMVSVQGSLAMFAIWKFGREEQKQTWLPRMAAGEAIGCFGLTEPDFGSNPAGMRTRAKPDGDGWLLNGTKTWITNGSVADVAVVWAQTDDGHPGVPGARRHRGLHHPHDPSQAVAARLGQLRADPAGRTVAGRRGAGRGHRPPRAAVLPERGPVRHRLRRAGRRPGLPGDHHRVRGDPRGVRPAAGRVPADPGQARRHDPGAAEGIPARPAPGPA